MSIVLQHIRRSQLALGLIAAGCLAFFAMILHVQFSNLNARLNDQAALVKALGLTDLALFTEARYTRHPSQADLHTPFQDHPMSFDHFPSGSLIGPPRQTGTGRLSNTPDERSRQ